MRMAKASAFDTLVNELQQSADVDMLLKESMTLDPRKVQRIPIRYRIIALGFVKRFTLDALNEKLLSAGCAQLYARSTTEASLIYAFHNGLSYPEWRQLLRKCESLLETRMLENRFFRNRTISMQDLTDYLEANSREAGPALETAQLTQVANALPKATLLSHCRLLEDALFAMQKSNAVKRVVAEMTLVRMCDASLDTSPEAMLSRIAMLEEQLATGNLSVSVKAPVPTPTEETPAPESMQKAPTPTPKRQEVAPTPPPVKEVPVVSAAPTPMMSTPTEKRILHPIRNWMEVVERISRSAPMTASFVKSSRAFATEDGKVIVRFENPFAMQMMEQGDARDRLRAAISAVLRREVGDRMLLLEVAGKKEAHSVIDEIIEAADGNE